MSTPRDKNASVFVPVRVPRRIYESFGPEVQQFIQRRIEKGEAVLLEDEA